MYYYYLLRNNMCYWYCIGIHWPEVHYNPTVSVSVSKPKHFPKCLYGTLELFCLTNTYTPRSKSSYLDESFHLMQHHWLVAKLHQRFRLGKRQRTQSCAVPADQNQSYHCAENKTRLACCTRAIMMEITTLAWRLVPTFQGHLHIPTSDNHLTSRG